MLGNLLIAHPRLPRNNPFSKTVIYIFQDNNEAGTQGIILNKPSAIPVSDYIQSRGWSMAGLTKETVRYGGPISPKTLVLLHTDDWYSASTEPICNGISVTCDDFMLEKMATGNEPGLWRMVVGICSWSPGQLELELSGKYPYRPENSWLTVKANRSIMFEHDGDKQWQKAMDLSSKTMLDNFF
jgi:putative AlgH/UPF0301 family transcriptional regulator